MRDSGTTLPERCDYCGTRFQTDVRYPTVTIDRPDDTVEIRTFCDDTCRSRWAAEGDP